MSSSPSAPRSRAPGCEVKSRGKKTNRHDRCHETLASIVPSKGKNRIKGPKYRQAQPDSRGAHLEENSTTQTRSASFASMHLNNVDFRLPV